jgi:hypothetical protein
MFPLSMAQGAFLLAQLRVIRSRIFGVSVAGRTQRARAANQNIIVGNTGAVRTGAQSANAVNS